MSRLEEIKRLEKLSIKYFQSSDGEMTHRANVIEVYEHDYRFLVQQVERVKELEEESKNKTELLGEIFLHHHWLKVGGISDKKFMNFMDEVSQKIYELNEIGGEDENE